MINKIITLCLAILLLQNISLGASKEREYIGLSTLNPERNAYIHNNKGLGYLNLGQYYAAIQEFKIAISLNPDTQATALYLSNLGETYIRLGYYEAAQNCFEDAMQKAPLNFRYYLNLVRTFDLQGISKEKLKYYIKNKQTPLDDIIIGLLYISTKDVNKGIAVLDNFVMNEPKLFITEGVKFYLKDIIEYRKNNMP